MTAGLGSCGVAVVDTLGGLRRENGIPGRGRASDPSAAVARSSLECVLLFSLLGVVLSAAVLFGASGATIAMVTAALMQ
jgi:hypothetical protein